jgi:hypothetical protein
VEEWLGRYARELGVSPLTDEERTALLRLARDVAHGTERRFAPLSTFLAGVAAGSRNEHRPDAGAEATEAAGRLLAGPADAAGAHGG